MQVFPFMTVVQHTPYLMIRDVPVTSCLLAIADNCMVLVDTGMVGNDQLLDEIDFLGYKPADISIVINTHLHVDHAGNNCLFPRARIIYSRVEWEWQIDMEKRLQDIAPGMTLPAEKGENADESFTVLAEELHELAKKYPLLKHVGDPAQIEWIEDNPPLPEELRLIAAPGHTPGSYAVQVQAPTPVLITGDALYHRDLWQVESLPALHESARLFQQTARRLVRFPGIIVPGHDRPFDGNGYYSPGETGKIGL